MGKVSIICDFIEGVYADKHTSRSRLTASVEEQMSLLMILVDFKVSEDARIWAHKTS